MNIGECPYPDCDSIAMVALPDGRLPKYTSVICSKCGRTVWHKFSRVDPQSWTVKEFFDTHDVDWTLRMVVLKGGFILKLSSLP